MQDQAIAKCELPGIQHEPVGILNDRITRHAPLFVLKNASTLLAGSLSIGLISVIPTGGGIGEHDYLPANSKQIPAAERQLAAIDLLV